MTPENLLHGMAPSAIALQIGMALAILFIALLVVMDSRDRGSRKEVAILWFFAIVIFPPVGLLYVLFRARTSRGKSVNVETKPRLPETVPCAYCGGQVTQKARVCPHCGRLL